MYKWLLICLFWANGAQAATEQCLQAIDRAAQASGVPKVVLTAVARIESGRGTSGNPFPWMINIEGRDRVFDSKAEAIRFARAALNAGKTSFDTGCFQINYRWHNEHFSSLDAMFDPETNAQYAARFLARLYGEFGNWEQAAGAYHSRTPQYNTRYRAKYREQMAALGGQNAPAPSAPASPNIQVAQNQSRDNWFPLLQSRSGSRAPGSLVPVFGN